MAAAWYDGSDRWTLLNLLNHASESAVHVSLDLLALYMRARGGVVFVSPRAGRRPTRVERARAAYALGWLRRAGWVSRVPGMRMWSITPFGRMEVKRRVEAAVHAAMTRPLGFTAADLGMSPDEVCESLPRAEV